MQTAAGDQEVALAHRYAPVVRLVDRSGRCGDDEAFEPTNVNAVLDNPEVALRGPWNTTNLVTVAPTAADLSVGLPGYNLDFPGNPLSPGCTYADWEARIAETFEPTVYAHVATEPGYPDRLSLQYWFFYIYNDWNNKHEGDWEMVQLNFKAQNASQALTVSPYEVGYSQHESSERALWGTPKLQIMDGTHPVVYPSLGSQANYYASNLYLGRSAAEGVGCDDTLGPSRTIRPVVVVIPQDPTDYLRQYPWLGYDGRWGQRQRAFFNGPTGPNAKASWTAPLTSAATNWRDHSYAVPGGDRLSRPATYFFCSAIAFGSGILTRIVGDPSPTLFGLALLLLIGIWLCSRTSWRPATPLRVRRRRAWGQLVTSAFRMYRDHPRLFLGIGLLFIPVGLVTAGLQYLLFRLGSLAPLVESAGRTNAFVEALVVGLGVLTTLLALTIVQAATAAAIAELDEQRSPTARQAYRVAVSRIRPLLRALATAIVVVLVLDLTAIGWVVGVWLTIRWSLLAQAVVQPGDEDVGPLRSSARLVHGHWWRTASIIGLVVGAGLVIGPILGLLLLVASNASFWFVDIVAALVNVVVLPYAAITTTYLYFDLEVRRAHPAVRPVRPRTLPAEA
jgi:hypothetical protein